MRDGALDVDGLLVERLQRLVVLLLGVHLDLERVDLEQLSALLEVLLTLLGLNRMLKAG